MTTTSIAMATYNGAKFIREQLDSLAMQSATPSELVVTDDGSTDNTTEIVADFAKNAPFSVRVLKNDHCVGFRANFMNCANLCSGDFIAFCDQDDVWHHQKLERLIKHFEDPSVFLACHNVALVDEQRRDLGATVHKIDKVGRNFIRDLLPFAYSHGFTQIFRRTLLPFSRYWAYSADCVEPDQPMAHDQYYVFISMLLGSVYYDDSILASYRQHSSNTTPNIVVPSRLESLRDKFLDRVEQYQQITFIAQNRLQLLKMLSSDHQLSEAFPQATQHFEEATELYSSYLECRERRLRLYSSKSAMEKAAILKEGLFSGDYKFSSKNRWGFTIRGALRDMTTLFT
jgi:glycosyltransferase involved in cell wall biosynthesis